jgi:glycosyltransferase involved in cell wall biosynthesis
MKVLFISDFSLSQNPGGAQVSNFEIINYGTSMGLEIEEFNYNSSPISLISNFDLVISSNLEAIMKSANAEYVYNYICSHSNHFRLEHDSCSYLHSDQRESIFGSSIKNFFLSQFHIDFFKSLYGDIFPNTEIVYDPIDTKVFFDKKQDRYIDILYCGFLHPLKGYNNLINFARCNPDRQITVYGWSQDPNLIQNLNSIKNIDFQGKASHDEMPIIFNKSNYIFHSPVVNEPFCRMAAEALLCGCKFIGDKEKIGSVLEFENSSYDLFSEACNNAPEIFWKKVLNNE